MLLLWIIVMTNTVYIVSIPFSSSCSASNFTILRISKIFCLLSSGHFHFIYIVFNRHFFRKNSFKLFCSDFWQKQLLLRKFRESTNKLAREFKVTLLTKKLKEVNWDGTRVSLCKSSLLRKTICFHLLSFTASCIPIYDVHGR